MFDSPVTYKIKLRRPYILVLELLLLSKPTPLSSSALQMIPYSTQDARSDATLSSCAIHYQNEVPYHHFKSLATSLLMISTRVR
jgi:hypothetical protein